MEAAILALILAGVLAWVVVWQVRSEVRAARDQVEGALVRETGRLDRKVDGLTEASRRARVHAEHVAASTERSGARPAD